MCTEKFTRKSYLKKHALTHTGERPHGCDIFGKRFTIPSDLRTHIQISTGK